MFCHQVVSNYLTSRYLCNEDVRQKVEIKIMIKDVSFELYHYSNVKYLSKRDYLDKYLYFCK